MASVMEAALSIINGVIRYPVRVSSAVCVPFEEQDLERKIWENGRGMPENRVNEQRIGC